MSKEEVVEEIQEEIAPEAVEDVVSDDQVEEVATQSEEEIMAEIAREGGWAPLDEWRGDKDKWKDAATFIREGIKIQGKQHDKIDRLQDSIKSVEENLKKMASSEAQRTRKALEEQKKRLEAERQEAFEMQDAEKFNEVDAELQNTAKQLSEQDSVESQIEEFERKFKERNNWYQDDKAMTAFAIQSAQHLKSAFPDLDQDSYMKELERIVKAQFPNEFRNPNKDAGGMVGSDQPKSTTTSKKKSFDSLPKEAKDAFEELNMYMPSGRKMSKADYAKSYYEDIA